MLDWKSRRLPVLMIEESNIRKLRRSCNTNTGMRKGGEKERETRRERVTETEAEGDTDTQRERERGDRERGEIDR